MEAPDVFKPDVLGRRGSHGGYRGSARAGARTGVPRGGGLDPCRSRRSILEPNEEKFRGPLWRRRPGRFSAADGPLALSSPGRSGAKRSEEHTSELQSLRHLVCRLLLEKKI